MTTNDVIQIKKKLLQNLEKILVKKRKIALAEREKQSRITKVKIRIFKLLNSQFVTLGSLQQTITFFFFFCKLYIQANYR